MQEYKVVPLSEYEYSPTMIKTGVNYGLSDYAKNKSIPLSERMDNINRYYENERKQIDNDLNKYLAKQYTGAALQIGSAAIPGSAGLRLGAGAIKALTPHLGKAIATEVGSGLAGGLASGAVEGFGRGLMEQKNPIKTAVQDGTIGLVTGGLGGTAIGKARQLLDRRALGNNTLAPEQYFADYVEGLSNNAPLGQVSRFDKGLADFRTAKDGNTVARTGTLFDLISGESPQIDTPAFKNWYGKSKTVDKSGQPLKLSHGSVNTFDTFKKDLASPESDLGAAFYFTNSASDVDANYFGGGPDFDNKVARLAERLAVEEDIAYDIAEERARNELMGQPSKIDAYLKMENPLYIGENETQLFDYDTYRQKAIDQYGLNPNDFDDINAFEDEVNATIDTIFYDEPYYLTNNLYDILDSDDVEKVQGVITDSFYNGGINFENLKSRLNDLYLTNPETGDLVGNEVTRRIVENLGYDGIIDSTVSKKFNMNLSPDTTHYVVFNPTQIKSVNNQGTFDPTNPNIYKTIAPFGTIPLFNLLKQDNNQ